MIPMKAPTRLPATLIATLSLLAFSAGHTAELLGYYAFEDDYSDSSGNGNAAIPSQNPDELSFADGLRGKALSINDPDGDANSGGSADIPIDANPTELPGVTFGGWVNVAEDFEFDGFMAMDNGGWDRGITVSDNTGATGFGVASGGAPIIGADITPGEWQYVVATFDTDEGVSTIYVGDSMAATLTTEATPGDDLAGAGEPVIEIGRYDNQDYNGLVDDVFVFDEALDAHHVNAIRNFRLSSLDYDPPQVSALFALFASGQFGVIGEASWEPASGLVADPPGSVADLGDGQFVVVLDDAGNGMRIGEGEADPDSDNDGLEDLWETLQFGNLDQTADGDPDEDGLTNLKEFEAGTRPTSSDTDRDGLADGAELSEHMTNPLSIDTDSDGYSDGVELAAGSDPTDSESVPPPPPPGILAYYDFEGTFDDTSGNDNTARPEMNPDQVSFIDGFRGQGAEINDPDAEANSGGSVNIPVDANPGEEPDISFGGWVNVAEEFEFDGFMSIDNGGWDRGITVTDNQGGAGFGIASGAAPVIVGEITPDEWQYVVATFNDSEDRGILYVGNADPAVRTTETGETPDAGDTPGEVEIEIGRYDNQDLNGVVDDIFVYRGELSDHQVNAIRNLRLSAIDHSPVEAVQLFELFGSGESGTVGLFTWTPVAGLAATPPGAVVEAGQGFTVVLDDDGNGMMSSAAPRFLISSITRDDVSSVTLTWNSNTNKLYAVDASNDLTTWDTLVELLQPTGEEMRYVDMLGEIATDLQRYYRVREQAPPKLFEEGFEEGAEGWTVGVVAGFSATGTAWELGAPNNNGPAAAFAGKNVYGTDLDANYEDATGIYLRSPVIDLTGAGRAKLTFQHFLAASDGEGGRLNILEADGAPTPEGAGLKLYIGPEGNTGDWAQESIRLADFDRPIILEFEILSAVDDDPINRAGWFIDDIVVD